MPTTKKDEKEKGLNESKLTPGAKRTISRLLRNYQKIEDTLDLSLYGSTQPDDDTKDLSNHFSKIMQSEMDFLNRHNGADITGFIAKLYEKDSKSVYTGKENTIDKIFGMESTDVFNFIADVYQNKKLKQNDLREIANQLIELREAILVFRDAIVSPDLSTGEISRQIKFEGATDEEAEQLKSTVDDMEEKFRLNERIKNYIIPNTLTQGDHYVYVIPYSRLFADYSIKMRTDNHFQTLKMDFRESASLEPSKDINIYETFTESASGNNDISLYENGSFEDFVKECYDEYYTEASKHDFDEIEENDQKRNAARERYESFKEELTEITKRVTISNGSTPIPFLEYGQDGIAELYRQVQAEKDVFTEAEKSQIARDKLKLDTATYSDIKKEEKKFKDIDDCYVKLIDSPHMLELKIMNHVLGYYYIVEDDVKPISGMISSTLYYNKYDDLTRQRTIIDKLVNKIVSAFDKKFLKENIEFKDTIAEALMYYDLNHKRIKFQFIPAEYICPFKINEDEEGNGTSIIEPSLFYAKLYLMLLLFKIMSIVLYSNDTRVNYVRSSGIDKNLANKIQDIARTKQERNINLMDLFSYTTLIRKVGNGAELYIPTGRSGERGIETEILQGQDVQLNTELMEQLRKQYILGTGVPDAIMNYLNEADFAKSIELANTKFQGRVTSHQLDFNRCLTQLYRMLAKYSTKMEDSDIAKLTYTLDPPKFNNNNVKSDMINSFNTLADFAVSLFFSQEDQNDPEKADIISIFKKKLIPGYLSVVDVEELENFYKDAILEHAENKANPANNNTEEIDDFSDDLNL